MLKNKQISDLEASIARRKNLLSNENYLNKAPKELVEKEKNTLKDEEYHELEIANISIENNEIGQVWIRPAASDNVEYIYVDRIFVVKE